MKKTIQLSPRTDLVSLPLTHTKFGSCCHRHDMLKKPVHIIFWKLIFWAITKTFPSWSLWWTVLEDIPGHNRDDSTEEMTVPLYSDDVFKNDSVGWMFHASVVQVPTRVYTGDHHHQTVTHQCLKFVLWYANKYITVNSEPMNEQNSKSSSLVHQLFPLFHQSIWRLTWLELISPKGSA